MIAATLGEVWRNEATTAARTILSGRWPALLGAATVTLACVVVVARFLDESEWVATIGRLAAAPEWAVLLLVAYTLAFWLRALAWKQLIGNQQRAAELFSVLLAALSLNHLLPLKIGDAARVYFLSAKGVGTARSAASTAVARLIEFATLVTIAVVAASLHPALSVPSIQPSPPLMAGGLAVILGALLAASSLVRDGARVASGTAARARSFLSDFIQSARGIGPRPVATAALLTSASWLLESVVLLAVARAAGVELALFPCLAITSVTLIGQAVPLTPGGLGVYEATMTAGLTAYGVGPGEALVLATATHAVKFAYSDTVGAVFLVREWVRLGPERRMS